jgi:adenine/guanine phosphoribosyltransferase-like PRPP-binding protein
MQPSAFWQSFLPADTIMPSPWHNGYPARLPDGRVLVLPIRPISGGDSGIASLILNQTAFGVEDALADVVADRLRPFAPDVVVGLPTLGLSLARAVAGRLLHQRYVAAGTSRKFWYEDALSVPLRSITSPDQAKQLYLDPRMIGLLQGRRVALIDDVLSSGRSIAAGLQLLALIGVTPVAIGAAMLQTRRWQAAIEPDIPVVSAIETPLLQRADGGWQIAA